MLDVIDSELAVNSAEHRLALTATILGSATMSNDSRKTIIKTLSEDLRRFEMIRVLDYDQANQQASGNSSLALASVYEMLQQAGALDNDQPDETNGGEL